MPLQTRCPHCDSTRVEQMQDRAYEATSATTWYQCLACKRMWSLPKNGQRIGRKSRQG